MILIVRTIIIITIKEKVFLQLFFVWSHNVCLNARDNGNGPTVAVERSKTGILTIVYSLPTHS